MARVRLTGLLTALALALALPAGAHARTPCPGEQLTPTILNTAQVSGAIFCLTNQIRASYGLPTVTGDSRLDTAALLHSADMSLRSFFDHLNPDGLSPGARAAAQGYTLGVGENIAMGYPTARTVVLGWMASGGHCRNVLSPARNLGVGTVTATTAYYTQVFG
ncbi:MAG: CAP domain-containing protein, partial [Solirubrobacteraceae bacterium]